jgi:molybdenum cofactor biosynthesis protein B
MTAHDAPAREGHGMSKAKRPFLALNVALVTVSDRRTRADDTSGDLLRERLEGAGHRVVRRDILREDLRALRAHLRTCIEDSDVHAVIVSGGTGITRHDIAPEALQPLVTRPIPGFGELFRMLSYAEIGAATIQSRAEAAIAGDTVIFLLPGSTNACRLAMDKIVLEQLNATTGPCNLVGLLTPARKE